MHTLILARALQGMGAGALMPVSLTLLADLYPIEQRTKVMGYNSTMWGIASVIGPLAGGLIVDTVGCIGFSLLMCNRFSAIILSFYEFT